MKRIKLSIAHDNEKCNRQLPSGGFVWKGYEFIINRPCEEADYWVVYSKGTHETEHCRVAPQNTLFITGEPDSVYHYSKGYVKQFAKVLSCQEHLRHNSTSYTTHIKFLHMHDHFMGIIRIVGLQRQSILFLSLLVEQGYKDGLHSRLVFRPVTHEVISFLLQPSIHGFSFHIRSREIQFKKG